jgi:hypothetical protein
MTQTEIQQAIEAAQRLVDHLFSIGKTAAGNELLGALESVDQAIEE